MELAEIDSTKILFGNLYKDFIIYTGISEDKILDWKPWLTDGYNATCLSSFGSYAIIIFLKNGCRLVYSKIV